MHHKLILLFLISLLIYQMKTERFGKTERQRFPRKTANTKSGKTGSCPFDICEKTKNYPKDEVKRIIENNPELQSFFGNVIEPSKQTVLLRRFGGLDFESFCKTVDITLLPLTMKDVNNVQRTIANVGGFQQIVKFQTCSQGEKCFGERLLDRKTKCLQKFHVIKLLTVDVDNAMLEYRDFQVPTTCVCVYES